MASLETTAPPHAVEKEMPSAPLKSAPPPEVPVYTTMRGGDDGSKDHVMVDVVLRGILFATALIAVVVMATAKQTKTILIAPMVVIERDAKFKYSPALIYFVAALSVACLYSLITTILSVLAMMKPGGSTTKLQFHFVILDALLLGIVAAATGTAGGVAYVGLKGNSHSSWNKICNLYDTYCQHLAGSIALSLVSSIALLLLIWLSVYTLSKKISR